MHQAGQVAVAELHRRKVDGDLQRLRPGRRLAAGLAQDPFADRDDQAALLGERDERRRARSCRAVGCCQRTSASKPMISPLMRGLRLVVQGRARCARSRERSSCCSARRSRSRSSMSASKKRNDAAAVALGAVERGVGVGRAASSASAPSTGKIAMPMLSPLRSAVAVRRRRRRRRPPAAARPAPRRGAGCSPSVDDQGELVAAEPRQECAARRRRAGARAISRSSSSPAAWPNTSLTSLKRSRSRHISANELPSLGRRLEGGVEAVVEGGAVGQAGERIVMREMRDLRLRALAVGAVLDHGEEILHCAAVRRGSACAPW